MLAGGLAWQRRSVRSDSDRIVMLAPRLANLGRDLLLPMAGAMYAPKKLPIMILRCAVKRVVFAVFALLMPLAGTAKAADLDLSAYRGKVVYLDFWASWCTPCRLSFPWMNEMQQTYSRNGLVVIGVNVDHDRALADEFLRASGPGFKIVYDPNGTIASQYNFRDMPTSVLIGRDGKVHFTHDGFFPAKEGAYAADIVTLLNQKAP